MGTLLMKGNEAIGAAAIAAGCQFYAGYPITPQNELTEYLAKNLRQAGGVFVQAESEISAINMVYGAAAAGGRAMTSSSSPGISLKMEGISYLAAAELPCVIVNVMRGGPGLGGIQPAQSDYFQATRGGGHGDYRMIVLAPTSVQEIFTLTELSFFLSEKYRIPVMILSDGLLGQMMETVDLDIKSKTDKHFNFKLWVTNGCKGRSKNQINTLYLEPSELEALNIRLQEKYKEIHLNEQRSEMYHINDAVIVLIAYGTSARIAKEAVNLARSHGIKAGLIRPITLWPFPEDIINKKINSAKAVLVVEMSAGQMVDDVRLLVNGIMPVHFYGRMGGMIPNVSEILEIIRSVN
jgi:2-oxoglutarate ferredoxin oxidoreductase subunit alpha